MGTIQGCQSLAVKGLIVKPLGATLVSLAVLAAGCTLVFRPAPVSDSFFSFEDGLEGWTTNGIDVGGTGSAVDDWSITRSQDLARDGTTSLKLYLANNNDAGKIFIERPFSVQPNHRYQVKVEFAFASQDWGDANLWTLIAGVLPKLPQTRDDLNPTYQGSTGNGSPTPTDFVWLDKSYTLSAQSDSSATLYVVIGVWGTYEVARTYYVDSVHVTIYPQPTVTIAGAVVTRRTAAAKL